MKRPDLGFVSALIRRDVRARLRDRWPLILWIAIPLAIGGMITAVGSGGGTTPVARLLLVDQDQSLVSGLLSGAFNQGPLANLVELETADEADARFRLDADEASAILVVPDGFGAAVLSEQPSELKLVTNPAQRILPGIVAGVLGVMVDGVFYLHRVLGPQIKTLTGLIDADDVPSDASVAAISVSLNQAIVAVGEYLLPPLLTVEFETDQGSQSEPGPGFGVLFFPGIVLMSLLFAAQSLADDLWKERESGTLRRLAVAPRSLVWVLVAKAGTVMLLFGAVCLVILPIGFGYHGLSPIRLPLSLLWLATGGVLLYALLSSVAILAPSRSSASVLTTALVFPMLMAGGSFFPFEAMPKWLAGIGQWLPNGYLLSRFKDYMLERSGSLELLSGLLFLVPITVALLALSGWRLRRFARS